MLARQVNAKREGKVQAAAALANVRHPPAAFTVRRLAARRQSKARLLAALHEGRCGCIGEVWSQGIRVAPMSRAGGRHSRQSQRACCYFAVEVSYTTTHTGMFWVLTRITVVYVPWAISISSSSPKARPPPTRSCGTARVPRRRITVENTHLYWLPDPVFDGYHQGQVEHAH
jgi:hypothetical protein